MKINKDISVSGNYMNDNGIVVSTSDGSGGDAMGRTARCALIYDEDRNALIQGAKSFFIPHYHKYGRRIYVTRYPGDDMGDYLRGNSRDHVVITISLFKELGEHDFVKDFIKHRAKRPCIEHGYTPIQRIWFRALYSKGWSYIYTIASLLVIIVQLLYTALFRTLSWTWKVYRSPEDFCKAHPDGTAFKHLNGWRRFWSNLVFPVFAASYTVHEINVISSPRARKLLLFFMRPFFDKYNYVYKSMCGKKCDKPDNYIPSRKNRWTVRLDDACDRDMRPFNDPIESSVELAMLEHYLMPKSE